ncbi:MAG: exodeoxyribonuclease VII large subunit [Clostridiales Family XIII bacterium]|jgi:exodeoxyribonuclease VII large subunit|nr:exodeoxyribonuclease VII large subunit [Clostridiales Family XIII bacterium]
MAVKPVTVSQLNAYIKRVLISDPVLGVVSVIGEISNLKYHGSGHIYFSLKDDTGRINCFLPAGARGVSSASRTELDDGAEVVISGYISVYEKGGYYSLNVTEISPCGKGNLALAADRLKEKLLKEGLFDEKYKRTLPFFPRKLAVVTSETGAAVQDILKIIRTRNKCVDVLIYPVKVQGDGAASEIAAAVNALNSLFPDTDCMIVGRGGGAAEELGAFNEEVVARAVFASEIPVISAVGHETDFCIMDFVADRRAETPTAAAQMAVPDTAELLSLLNDFRAELSDRAHRRVEISALRVKSVGRAELLAAAERAATGAARRGAELKSELSRLAERGLSERAARVATRGASLASLDPSAVLARGYAVLTSEDGAIISSVTDARSGDAVKARLADGELALEVV